MAVPLGPKYLAGKRAYTNFRDTIEMLTLAILENWLSTQLSQAMVQQ